ncbi:hypothetical protein ACLB2K_009130 [Fragaria x ananassa]
MAFIKASKPHAYFTRFQFKYKRRRENLLHRQSASWLPPSLLLHKTLRVLVASFTSPTQNCAVPQICASAELRQGYLRSTNHKMSGDEAEVPVTAEPMAVAAAPALGEPMDLMTALQLVLRKSLAHGGLTRGLHEAAKVIEKHAAQLCILAEDCNQADYVKLVKSLCAEHNVNLMTIPSAKTLGEWSGIGCSCIVVKDFGENTKGLHFVQEYVKSQQSSLCNIRVFCRVRPLLGENVTEDSGISYPTSTETLGRGIGIVKAGTKHHFVFNKVMEGERFKIKLHNKILDLKGNIRVFFRVRPLLGENAIEYSIISYPTSTETLGRGIDIVKGTNITLCLT